MDGRPSVKHSGKYLSAALCLMTEPSLPHKPVVQGPFCFHRPHGTKHFGETDLEPMHICHQISFQGAVAAVQSVDRLPSIHEVLSSILRVM